MCHPHSFDRVTKIKFKPNENVLFTCGQDGCFKSWILSKSCQSDKFNWAYSTSNGYRDMNPTDVEFLHLNNSQFLAVSFNYIVTIWKCELDNSFWFVDDLIHCHSNETVKFLQKLSQSNLIVVNEQNLNVWNFDYANADESLLHSAEPSLSFSCVLSEPVDDVLFTKMINQSQVIIISRKLKDTSQAIIKGSLNF